MGVATTYEKETKADIQIRIERMQLQVCRSKANISKEILNLRAAESRMEALEQQRDMAFS